MAIVLLLLLFAAIAILAISIGLCWLLVGHSGEDEAAPDSSLSLTQSFARELDRRRWWRALSSWLDERPLRIAHRRDPDRG